MASVTHRGGKTVTGCVSQVDLPPGVVSESYSFLNIQDRIGLSHAVETCLKQMPGRRPQRAGVCLPDGIFRVQTLDFDELPGKNADRERLIRWRLDKTAAFDLMDTLLRYQVLGGPQTGFTVLACVAKKDVIAQYESILNECGIEPWFVGITSFMTAHFYAAQALKAAHALVCVNRDSFATIVSDNGEVRFYRYKEVKRANADDICSRLAREIEDSLYFYNHQTGPGRRSAVGRLYLSGETGTVELLKPRLADDSLEVEVLVPGTVIASSTAGAEMAAAFGAGATV